jgi:NADH-quinone oxidoreductase subunit M
MYDRTHSRAIADYSGLMSTVPVFGGLFLFAVMSSIALPGLNGFVGEFPILLGAFQEVWWAGAGAAFGMVLAALYLLWAYQRVFHGPLEGAENENTADLRPRELLVLAPLVTLIVAIGIYPQPLFDRLEPTVTELVEMVNGAEVEAAGAPAVEPAPAQTGVAEQVGEAS